MITDEMMSQAAAELAEALNKSLPAPSECTHRFSAKFERKMKRLMQRVDHPMLYRTLRAVASIIIVLFIGFGSVLTVSAEAREIVFGWVKQQYETFFEYIFEGELKSSENVKYSPQWIPEGYELSSVEEMADGEMYTYFDDNGQWLVFCYLNASNGSKVYADSPGYDQCDIEINGNPGSVYISHNPEESNLIVWTDKKSKTLLYLTGVLDKNSMISFSENVIKINN